MEAVWFYPFLKNSADWETFGLEGNSVRNRFRWSAYLILLAAPCVLLATTGVEFRIQGMALYKAGQYQKAVTYFLNAIQANPKDWKSDEDLGSAYERLNDPVDALAAYRKSLRLNPGDANLRIYVKRLSKVVRDLSPAPKATPPPLPGVNPPTPRP
jgi:tetratricopeptide (TPR) repeat protein